MLALLRIPTQPFFIYMVLRYELKESECLPSLNPPTILIPG